MPLNIRLLVEQDLLSSRDRKARQPNVFYASELGLCPVKVFFNIVRPQPVDADTLRIFRVGDLVHGYIQQLAQREGAQVEVPIRSVVIPEKNIELHGRIDILHKGEPYELKSSARIPDAPLPHHVAQLNAYMHLLDVPIGYLVYIEKNTFDIEQFTVLRDPRLWRESLRKISLIYDAVQKYLAGERWERQLVDLALRERHSWECRRCVYRMVCPVDYL